MFELFSDSLLNMDFANIERLKTLIRGTSSSMMNSIASNGHTFAKGLAASGLDQTRMKMKEVMSGLTMVNFVNQLASIEDLSGLMGELKDLWKTAMNSALESRTAIITTNNFDKELVYKFHGTFKPCLNPGRPMIPSSSLPSQLYIPLPFQTNFCARVFQTDPSSLYSSANLSILSKLLKSRFLHREIREKGGAYGGGSGFSSIDGLFSLYSYRDPNPQRTVSVFDEALKWFMETKEITDQVI